MSSLTKRNLKKKITKMSINEVISLIDIGIANGAIDAKDEDLVELAFLAQHQHERAGTKFAGMINEGRIALFFNALDTTVPLGTIVETIQVEGMLVCKKIK